MTEQQPHVHCQIEPTSALGWAGGKLTQLTAWRLECGTCGAVEKFLATDESMIKKFDLFHAYCGDKS